MRTWLFIFAILLVCPRSWGANDLSLLNGIDLTPVVQDHVRGFYNPTETWVPAKVRESRRAVFDLIVVADDPGYWEEMNRTQFETEVQAAKRKLDAGFATVYREILDFYSTVQGCEGRATCHLPTYAGVVQVSGVLVGQKGRTMYSVLHGFKLALPALLAAHHVDSVRNLAFDHPRVSVFLFDADLKMKADPLHNPARLIFSGAHSLADLHAHRDQDLVQLEFEHSLGRGLELASRAPDLNARVFYLGYSACTGCQLDGHFSEEQKSLMAARSPYPDSHDGLSLTTGVAIQSDRRGLVRGTGDGNDGMSGGAYLSSDGNLVGIIVGIAIDKGAPFSYRRLVYSVDLLHR